MNDRDASASVSRAHGRTNGAFGRRSFLAGAAAGALTTQLSPHARGDQAPNDSSCDSVTDFCRSHMHCAPNKAGIWVRIQIECLCDLSDRASGRSERFALGVVAKTGLGKIRTTGAMSPGYDYWLIFSRDRIYTRRTHATVYCRNPTVLDIEAFGPIGWRLHPAPATVLQHAADVKKALEGGRRIVGRTQLSSSDGARTCLIEYPVKWADCATEMDGYRVETGPVIFLEPDRFGPGQPLQVEDFQWTHLDYHSADHTRCLMDRPTSILSDAAFYPPKEDGREHRPNPALTPEQVKSIEDRLFSGWDMPLPAAKMRELFQTDHYSEVADRKARNWLYAID